MGSARFSRRQGSVRIVILLDTHVLVWLGNGDPMLGKQAWRTIREDGNLHASVMSYWEAAMLVRKRRLTFATPAQAWLDQVLEAGGMQLAPVTSSMAADAGALPPPLHGDPCDRLLVATARSLNCSLVTADEKILRYAELGHLRAVDARL